MAKRFNEDIISEVRQAVYDVLVDAFEASAFLHSVGSGDEEAVMRALEVDFEEWGMEVESFMMGAIMGRAMCSADHAMQAAEELIDAVDAIENGYIKAYMEGEKERLG